MTIPHNHVQLLEEVSKVNENIVVVLLGGSSVEMSWISNLQKLY